MATKTPVENEELEVTAIAEDTEDAEVDLPVSDEVEIDDGDLEDEEFFEETTEDDEEVTEED